MEQALPLIISIASCCIAIASFYSLFLHRFKPKLYINNFVLVNRDNESGIVSDITLSISFSNSRNSYGLIQSLALGFINERCTPEVYKTFYYASLAGSSSELANTDIFSPIVLQPKSFTTSYITFKPDDLSRGAALKHFSAELYGKFSGSKKWYYIDNICLFPNEDVNLGVTSYTNISHMTSVNNIKDTDFLPRVETLRKGFEQSWINRIKFKVNRILKKPLKFLAASFVFLWAMVKGCLSNIFNFILYRRLLFSCGTKHPSISIREVPPRTAKTDDLVSYLNGKFHHFLKKSDLKEHLNVLLENHVITLNRDSWSVTVKAYRKDTVSVTGALVHGYTINDVYKYKNLGFGLGYWTYQGRYISKYKIACRIIDRTMFFSA